MALVQRNFFNNLGVFKIHYSPQIQHKLFIHLNYNLAYYSNVNDNCLFVGCYWTSDVMNIKNNQVNKYILWTGEDIINLKNFNYDHFDFILQITNLKHFCLNEHSQKLLADLKIPADILNLDITENIIVNKIDFFIRDYIFVLDKENKNTLDHKVINYNNTLLQSRININYIYKYLPYIKFVIRLNYEDYSLDTMILLNYFQKFYIPIFSNDKFYNSIKYIDFFSLNNLLVMTNKNLFYKNYFQPRNIDYNNLNNLFKFTKPKMINKIFYIKDNKYFESNLTILDGLNLNYEVLDINTTLFNKLILILFYAKKEQHKNILILTKFANINNNILNILEVYYDEFMNKKLINISNDVNNIFNGLLINHAIYDDLLNLFYKHQIEDIEKIINNNYKVKFINNIVNVNSLDLPITEITIILYVYNNSTQLINCLESLNNQLFNNYKVIIINNNSSDNSQKIINKFIADFNADKFFIVNNYETLKFSTCINNTLKLIINNNSPNSKYVTWFKTDFIPANNYINELYNIAINNQSLCAFGNYTMTHPNSYKISSNKFLPNNSLQFLLHSDGFKAFLFNLDIFNNVDLLDEELSKVENLDFTLRCFEYSNFTFSFNDIIIGSFIDNLYITPEEQNNIIQQEEALFRKLIDRHNLNFNFYIDNFQNLSSLEKNIKVIDFCEQLTNSKKKAIKNILGKFIPSYIFDVYNHDRNNIISIEYLNKWAQINKDKQIIEKTFNIINQPIILALQEFLRNKKQIFIIVSNINTNVFERQLFIIRNIDKSFAKFYIGVVDNPNNFEIKDDIFCINRNIYNTLKNYILDNNLLKIVYFSEVNLTSEISKYKKYFKNIITLFDLASISEMNYSQLFESAIISADKVTYSHPDMLDMLQNVANKYFERVNYESNENYVANNKTFYYLPNGCENIFINFTKLDKPSDIPYTDRPIIGYFGDTSLIDYNIIEKYLSNTKYHLLIINQSNSPIQINNYNLTVLPKKDYSELPNYIAWFDKCFIPLINSPYESPQSLWQMVASGKTVLKHGLNIDTSNPLTWDLICKKLHYISLGFNNSSLWKIINNHNEINIKNLLTLLLNKCPSDDDLELFNKTFNYHDLNDIRQFTFNDIMINYKKEYIQNIQAQFYNIILNNLENIFDVALGKSFDNLFDFNNFFYKQISNSFNKSSNQSNVLFVFSSTSYDTCNKSRYITNYITNNKIFYVYPDSDFKTKQINQNVYEVALPLNNINRNISKLQELFNFKYFVSLILPEDQLWLNHIQTIKCTNIINQNIPFGCDYDTFANIKNNQLYGKYILGYIGDLNSNLDIKLIESIAKKYTYPRYEIFLIGNFTSNDPNEQQVIKNLKRFQNLRIIETNSYNDLLKYIPMLSLAFIPNNLNILNSSYLNCLAYGIPVLAKNISIESDFIFNYSNNDDFINNIETIISKNLDIDKIKEFALTYSWPTILKPLFNKINHYNSTITFIINDSLEIEKTLSYLNKNANYPNYEIIVITNNTYDIIPDYLSDIKLIHFDNMLINIDSSFNFSHMFNDAVINSVGDFVVMLDDNIINENFAANIIRDLLSNNDVVSVNPITNLSYHDSQLFIYHNDFLDFIEKATLLSNQNPASFETNIISSCVAFNKNDLFSVGLLDPNIQYTAYYHDLNYKFKLFKPNSKNLVTYNAICYSYPKVDIPENTNKAYIENKWIKKLPKMKLNFDHFDFKLDTYDKYLENIFTNTHKLINNIDNLLFITKDYVHISDNTILLTQESILLTHNATHVKFTIPKLSSDISIPKNNDLIQNIYRILFTYSLKLFNNSL